ncbi:MAG: hypothetical protein H7X86_08345 [Gorillibacterium sp.]|nr:hypothetical protein [Gorillibacterium sp.]
MIALQLGTPATQELRSLLMTSGNEQLPEETNCQIAAYENDLLIGVGGWGKAQTSAKDLVFFIHPDYENRELRQNMSKLLTIKTTNKGRMLL